MNKNLNIVVLIAFNFLLLNVLSQQIETTTITCLTVQADGSVGITWTPIPDENGIFNQYNIASHNTNTQNSTAFESEPDINNTFFLDNSVNAGAGPVSYQIVIEPISSTTYISSFSNILSTIFLEGNFTPGTGTANLVWNDPVPNYSSIPDGATYKLMEEYPVGDWHEVALFPYEAGLDNYDHPVSVCNDLANYRLELCFPEATCSSISNQISLNVIDETAPPIPQITSISVDTLMQTSAIIDWNSINAPDCGGYIVTWCDAPGLPQQQYVFDCNQTEFVFPTAMPNLSSEHFLVASFDTCEVVEAFPGTLIGNLSPNEGNCPYIHSSIHLNTEWTTCQDYIRLNWTKYTGWGNNGVAFYEVYKRENGGVSEKIATLEPDISTFADHNIENDKDYCYFIWAYSATVNNAQSISNIECQFTLAPAQPANFNVSTATVMADDLIAVNVNTEQTANPFNYVLLRKSDRDPFFQEIDNIISNGDTPPVAFNDLDVNTAAFSYDYQIALINQCNDTVNISNLGRTIKLSGLANSKSLINTITWNAYEDWENGVNSYEIYRSVDGEDPILIAVSQAGVQFYEDDVSDQLESKGEFCYFVMAVEGNTSIGLPAQSASNVLCLAQPPKVFIPEAFVINGLNDEFFPVISFADRDSYRLVIFNRWGQQLFISNDVTETWDGTKNGNLIQEGTYTYYMEISDGSGQIFEYRGPVTLLILDAN